MNDNKKKIIEENWKNFLKIQNTLNERGDYTDNTNSF